MNNQQIVVAITGGIGSGKSLVAEFFRSWGAAIVDADQLARQVVAPGSDGIAEVQRAFPEEQLILADGSLNRSKLASIIFADESSRKRLEAILHPRIRKLWRQRLDEIKQTEAPVIAYVVPLYFESTHQIEEIQKVILVTAPDELKISRILARDGFSREAAQLRLKAQLPDQQKISRSDFVIYNDSTLEAAKDKAWGVYQDLVSQNLPPSPI
jgi:dephospho-CoA kinase